MNCVIFGAGGWGTAMAIHLARQGQTVTLVPRRAEQALALATTRENTDYLPGHRLDDSIQIGLEPLPALMDADLVFLACPSKGLPELLAAIGPAGIAVYDAHVPSAFFLLAHRITHFGCPATVLSSVIFGTP